jgi:TRAP-type mannitol/chloroaromatic compound transport system permease large subunit
MGNVFSGVGLDHWLGGVIATGFDTLAGAPIVFVLGLAIVCFALNLVLRLLVLAPLVVVAAAPVAASLGIDPWVVAIVAITASNGFLLPHQSNIYLAFYNGTNGRLFSHARARPLAVLYAALVLIGLTASAPLWQAMGLL